MRITLLANRDLASNQALNYLLPRLAPEHQLSVFLSSRVGGNSHRPTALQQLAFFEQSLFNLLLFPSLDKSPAQGAMRTFDDLGAHCRSPIAELNLINSDEGLARLAATEPELILSIRYGGILREAAIALPAHGVVNLHSGLLPGYRGVMASFWALLHGEQELGTTLHTIDDAGIDTGSILATTRLPVTPGKSYLWHVLQLYPEGCQAILDYVAALAAGQKPSGSPQPAAGNYYSFPDEPALQRFHAGGLTLFDTDEITLIAQQYLE